jgi:hypothetical protein
MMTTSRKAYRRKIPIRRSREGESDTHVKLLGATAAECVWWPEASRWLVGKLHDELTGSNHVCPSRCRLFSSELIFQSDRCVDHP